MKKIKRILWLFLITLMLCSISFYILIQITPKPVAYLTRYAFSNKEDTDVYGHHPDFEVMKENVTIQKDNSFMNESTRLFYDLYVPKDTSKSYPVLFWIHGGAFIGGDKQDVADYMTTLASQGYVVYVLNYSLAPNKIYPMPVYETSAFVKEMLDENPSFIDKEYILVGGDSAGAHIAFQFVTTQVNQDYQEKMKMAQVIDSSTIKGVLSFSGLLDITMYNSTDSQFSNFLYDQSAWAYFDEKHWKEILQENGADFLPYLNSSFPPTYITDGDKNSFLEQAIKVRGLLEKQHVEVDHLLWEEGEHLHEYQFQLDTDAALKNYQQVLSFLKRQTNK